jgi:hypothetical protein
MLSAAPVAAAPGASPQLRERQRPKPSVIDSEPVTPTRRPQLDVELGGRSALVLFPSGPQGLEADVDLVLRFGSLGVGAFGNLTYASLSERSVGGESSWSSFSTAAYGGLIDWRVLATRPWELSVGQALGVAQLVSVEGRNGRGCLGGGDPAFWAQTYVDGGYVWASSWTVTGRVFVAYTGWMCAVPAGPSSGAPAGTTPNFSGAVGIGGGVTYRWD